jgi:hypothetical protein
MRSSTCCWDRRRIVERHSRVLFETERAAVGKTDPERRIAAGLDHVALNTRSPTFKSTATPLRVTVAVPLTVSTRPIGCCAAGAAA